MKNYLKRTLMLTLIAMLTCATVNAAKARPGVQRFKQPDGSFINIVQHGDENFSWFTDDEGNVLKFDGKQFTPTGQTDAKMREEQSRMMQLQAATRASLDSPTMAYFPHSGTPRCLVILAQFPNRRFTVGNRDSVKLAKTEDTIKLSTKEVFNQYLNKLDGAPAQNGFNESYNYGSVAAYFRSMSNGNFTPQFDIVGPVTLPREDTYYGANDYGIDDHYEQLIGDACALADDSVNFKDYLIGDGTRVPLVCVIYAGFSESNRNVSSMLWPKAFTSRTLSTRIFDGVNIGRFCMINELNNTPTTYTKAPYRYINGVGLFCHEFSHTMGLPDLYPSESVTYYANNMEPEYWDLMDGGEYTFDGYCPTPYSPWEREIFDWGRVTQAPEDDTAFTIANAEAARIDGPNPSRQRLYLQNIPLGGWYTGLNILNGKTNRMHGLLVWRINYASDLVTTFDYPNNDANNPRVAIVPADGVVLNYTLAPNDTVYLQNHAGDVFPGTSNVANLTPEQALPNYNWGKDSNGQSITIQRSFKNITILDDGTISINDNSTSGVVLPYNEKITEGAVYTIDGRFLGNRSINELPAGIYIVNGNKVVVP